MGGGGGGMGTMSSMGMGAAAPRPPVKRFGRRAKDSDYLVQQGCTDAACRRGNARMLNDAATTADEAMHSTTQPVEAMHAAAKIAQAAIAANGVDVPCQFQRMGAAEVRALTKEQRKERFEVPTIVTGLTDGWAAYKEWSNPHNFSTRFGHHRMMAKRASFSYMEAQMTGASLSDAEVFLAEAVELATSVTTQPSPSPSSSPLPSPSSPPSPSCPPSPLSPRLPSSASTPTLAPAPAFRPLPAPTPKPPLYRSI